MANRFWVGGTGTWDNTNNGHWSTTSNGTGNQAAPTSADVVTFDGSSGGGTVTVAVTINASNTITSLTLSAFTGTLDFSANDPNITLTAAAAFVNTGSGTRTLNMGDGTWSFPTTSSGTVWSQAGATNLTFNANGSTLAFSGNSVNQRTFAGGAFTYNNISFGANTSGGPYVISAANTFNNLAMTGPCQLFLPSSTTQTVASLSLTGTSGNEVFLTSNSNITAATISDTAGTNTLDWSALRGIIFAGGATFVASNSFDLGLNTGITITAPNTATGASRARSYAGL